MDTKQRLVLAGASLPLIETGMALTHQGPIGLIVGAVAAYALYQFTEGVGGEEHSSPSDTDAQQDQAPQNQELSFVYRLLNGKSVRGDQAPTDDTQDEPQPTPKPGQPQKGQEGPWIPPQFLLDDVLTIIHDFNRKGFVYLGDSEEGAIAIELNAMYHVFDVSSSGKGKSNRFRLAMMQMVNRCETYYINPFAASVKAVIDHRKVEVWQPIYDRLANKRPIKDGEDITHLLTLLLDEITQRNEQENQHDFSWQERPIFVFIDELPEVSARCPDAIKLLDRIGRGGRQFCIFLWLASQTANVNDTGLSTAAQAQFKTRIYGGGDKTSADRMMKGTVPKDTERTLQTNGAGLTLMLADGMVGSTFVRSPLVTNEGLFTYLGLPAFNKEDWMNRGKATALLPQPSDSREETPTFPPFTVLPTAPNPPATLENAFKGSEEREKRKVGKSEKRGKGPHDEAILMAMDELEEEERPLTMNAIAKRAGLTRHQYDDIEEIAAYYGYQLARGIGRPAKEA